jgi:hypothetical protein
MSVSNLTSVMRTGICTSTTRPTAPYEGQMIYETDTDLLLLWNGSAWKALMQATTAGSVLQVVLNQPAFADQSVNTTTETLYINPLATITPRQSTSRILIYFTFGAYPTGFHNYYSLYIRRGAVGAANKIASNGGGWQGDWTNNYQMHTTASYNVSAHQQYSVHAWDNAGTTSTINYVLTGANLSGSASSSLILWSAAINRVTLIEIAQ